ncbi:uncharacterized protein V6R79_000599 [Siganus canaliculatus]
MGPALFLLLVSLGTVELRRVHPVHPVHPVHVPESVPDADRSPGSGTLSPGSGTPGRADAADGPGARRVSRGAKDRSSWSRDQQTPRGAGPPRRYEDPYFTTSAPPGNSSSSGSGSGPGTGLLNPLFPVTDGSYWAYAVMLLALLLFAAGIVGNLALMCIVWHNFYLKSTWNCILAGLAFWDFLVLFFCLPVVIFHELTLKRLLGDLSCRLVPYLEVTSLGVATFSLCALSIDRFHAATGPGPLQTPKVEPCHSILSKLAVIWVGSMVLASPELLLWQLLQETVDLPALPQNQSGSLMAALRARSHRLQMDVCVREPWAELPDQLYSLVLTYQEARAWWLFGCYTCLPLLFTLACDLVTRQVLAQQPQQDAGGQKPAPGRSPPSPSQKKRQRLEREQRLRSSVMALAVLYAACNLPEAASSITLAYLSGHAWAALPAALLPALGLMGQLLLFARCAATPLLLLVLCRSLGQAFMDCCCCCCEECLPDSASSACSTAAASSTTAASSLSAPCGQDELKSRLGQDVCCRRTTDSAAALGTPC